MTYSDLDKKFKLYVDKADNQGMADFRPLERQQFLNDAQSWLASKVSFSKTDDQDAVDVRRSLSTPAKLTVSGGTAQLPPNYLAHGTLSFTINGNWVLPRIVSENELLTILADPFNAPELYDPVACYLHNQLQVYPTTGIAMANLSYYRQPALLDMNIPDAEVEFVDALLPSLVQRAVQLALESVQDPRFQTQAAIATLTEAPLT